MVVGGAFSNDKHLRTLSEERRDGKKDWDAAYKTKLKGLVRDLKGTYKRLLLHTKSTGAWPIVRSTTVSESVNAKPLIHQGCTIPKKEIRQGSYKDKGTRGDVMVQGLWGRQVDAIIGVKLGDSDADSYKYCMVE